jgi:uncharacterized membrane protein
MNLTLPGMPAHGHIDKDGFRLRGTELARIDAFSDVVFGFALTLLVVSLEVPKTFAELHESLRQFVPFAICFYFFMVVWVEHYRFFRRFGTHDNGTIAINGVLLFVVLFYVYPLKFLFTVVAFGLLGYEGHFFETQSQVAELMVLFGVAFSLIHILMAALYANGYRQRRPLGLTPVEEVLTRGYILQAAVFAMVGVLACFLAKLVPPEMAGYTGWTYLGLWPVGRLLGWLRKRRIRKLERTTKDSSPSHSQLVAAVDAPQTALSATRHPDTPNPAANLPAEPLSSIADKL